MNWERVIQIALAVAIVVITSQAVIIGRLRARPARTIQVTVHVQDDPLYKAFVLQGDKERECANFTSSQVTACAEAVK